VTPPGEWRIWHEWEQASKGRRQILWSRRRVKPASKREELWNALLDARGASAEESDEVLAAREVVGETLGEISRTHWYGVIVWRPELVAKILEMAETSGVKGISQALRTYGVPFIRRPAPS
jgi:hypothetical protein